MSKTLFLDIETTGFSRQWEYIIELAAIVWDEQAGRTIDKFHEYIRPGKSIPLKVTELTGITNEQVRNCRNEFEVLADFCEFVAISGITKIVGHNCKAFDLSFIREKCAKYKLGWNEDGIEIVDTLAMARNLNKAGKISTENCQQPTLAAYFNIQYDAHSAINDVEALIKLYQKMIALNKPITRAELGF